MNKIKVKKVRKIEKLNYLHSFIVDYKTKSGVDKTWEMVSRHGQERLENEVFRGSSTCDAIMVFAREKGTENLVILKEYRVTAGRYLYMFPAGLVDVGEDLEVAAKREFFEETGLSLEVVKIQKEKYSSIGMSNEKIAVAYGYFEGIPTKDNQEDSEDAEIEIIDKNRAIEILENDEISIRASLLLEYFYGLNEFMERK